MTKTPIMEFRDEKQAVECLNEWKHRLGLSDWNIKIVLTDRVKDEDCSGRYTATIVNKSALIEVVKNVEQDFICKLCAEQTLIHELCHLKIGDFEYENTLEGREMAKQQHQVVEDMAKALLMAKYNLTIEWFRNF